MKKIKNKLYRQFLDEGIIKILTEDDIKKAMGNITGKHIREGRALLILMYYTGCRPVEALTIKGKDVKKSKSYLKVLIQGSKRGLPRTQYLPLRLPLVKELYTYVASCMPEMFLFFNYRTFHKRTYMLKDEIKGYISITDGLRQHFKKWFRDLDLEGISPYYLRHNRFSRLSEQGLDMQTLRMMKGSKTYDSIVPYLHMSAKAAKQAARKLD